MTLFLPSHGRQGDTAKKPRKKEGYVKKEQGSSGPKDECSRIASSDSNPIAGSGLSERPDLVTALARGSFSEHALGRTAAQGFSTDRAVRTAAAPVGGRLHVAKEAWDIIDADVFVRSVVERGYEIQGAEEHPRVPHDGKNPPAAEQGKVIPDREVDAMLKKKAIRVADMSVDGVISGCFARPKKTEGRSVRESPSSTQTLSSSARSSGS